MIDDALKQIHLSVYLLLFFHHLKLSTKQMRVFIIKINLCVFRFLLLFCSSYDNKSYGTTAPTDSPKIVYCLHGRLSKNCCNEQVLELTQIESKFLLRWF